MKYCVTIQSYQRIFTIQRIISESVLALVYRGPQKGPPEMPDFKRITKQVSADPPNWQGVCGFFAYN